MGEYGWGNVLAELEKDLLKNQHRARAAQDGERLTGKQRVGHSRHGGAEQGLDGTLEHMVEMQRVVFAARHPAFSARRVCSYDASLCGLPQQPSEGDHRRHAGAVEEEEGGHALEAHPVLKVAQVERSFPLDVLDQPSKQPEHSTQAGSPSSAVTSSNLIREDN